MLAIRNLCSRAIVIDEGRVTADTDAGAGVATYLGRSLVEGAVATEQEIGARLEGTMKRSEIPYLRITEIRLADQNGVAKASFASTEPVTVCVSFECLQTARDVRIVVAAADEDGVPIYGSQNTDDCGVADHFYVLSPGRYAATCQFPPNVFGNKKYYLNVQMLYPKKQHLVLTKILGFRVRFDGYNPAIQYAGNDWGWPIWPKLPWGLNRIAAP
jgi:lipopolysaccharide transport system ATP-binding protein